MMNVNEKYSLWLDMIPEQNPLHRELEEIQGDTAGITDRFYRDIEFGTAGLRGICGAGTNRMNSYTVGRATQGIAAYILKSGKELSRGAAIAYDARYHSREFSELAAEILAGNGIRCFLFPSLRPTPELSYAIRKLGCISGINMTASHNPKEYNGYKVYWEDGAQISGEVSDGMLAEILKLDFFEEFKRMPLEVAKEKGLIVMLGEETDCRYLDYVLSLSERSGSELDLSVPIVYTPLNGAGSIPFTRIAEERGFTNFRVVSEQRDPDPEFTTVPFPNPENPKAFALAEKLGKEIGAEVLIATDPDSDRMAIEIADGKGGYRFLNGNQTGGLIISYLAESRKEHGKLAERSGMIKSIVTGDFGKTICEDYGIRVFETLTGFKNICGKIPELRAAGYEYFFGYEESIGCAPGEEVRDKDGISAGMLIAEMTACYRKKDMSLAEVLDALYRKYGYFAEGQISIVLEGQQGAQQILRIMKNFREGSPAEFGMFRVKQVIDYIDGYDGGRLDGEKVCADIDFIPPQNAMKFIMTDGSWFAIRPSGTEPKIKFYYYTRADSEAEAYGLLEKLEAAVQAFAEKA